MLISINLKAQDTVYPVKLRFNNFDLNCFKPEQSEKIYKTYLLWENCKANSEIKDSNIVSLKKQADISNELLETNKGIITALSRKGELYESIIKEKDNQLKLKDREGLIKELKAKKPNYALEIFAFLAGGLLGYAITK